jgi:hypothetical protein
VNDLRWIDNCVECGAERETTFTHDGKCVGCIAYMIEDLV